MEYRDWGNDWDNDRSHFIIYKDHDDFSAMSFFFNELIFQNSEH